MKKFVSLLLSTLMLFSLVTVLAVSAYAEERRVSGDYTYIVLNNGTAAIVDYKNYDIADLEIPSKLDGYTVSSIGEGAFQVFNNIVNVTIPNSVTRIEDYAFHGCINLKNVKIPNGVKYIGYCAFDECESLTSVVIPDSVTEIGTMAFAYCTSLKDIVLSKNLEVIGNGPFHDTAYYNDNSKWDNGVLYIGTYLLESKESLSGSYAIKDNTTIIARGGLMNTAITDIKIPNSVKSIGGGAFEKCFNLKSVTIPKSVTVMYEGAFYNSGIEIIYILNDNCKIDDEYSGEYTIPGTATIYGNKGSTAEKYAKKYGRKFVAFDEETTKAPTTSAPTTEASTTKAPTTTAPTTKAPTTVAPTMTQTTSQAGTTNAPTTKASTTTPQTTTDPTTTAPTTSAPVEEFTDEPSTNEQVAEPSTDLEEPTEESTPNEGNPSAAAGIAIAVIAAGGVAGGTVVFIRKRKLK